MDKALLQRVADGDEKAFAELFYSYHNRLGEFIQLLTGSTELMEEIVQDVFVKVWMKRSQLTGIDKFDSWLFIIARNYTLNCLRDLAKKKKKSAEYRDWKFSEQENNDPAADPAKDPEYLSLFERAVAQLPSQQQKVFVLSRREGLSHQQIAEKLNISYATVKKNIQWANRSISRFVKTHADVSIILMMLSVPM